MHREQWLAERKKGITSTDAAAIACVSPWAGPLDIYLDKCGDLQPREPSKEMTWGLRLEPVLAQAYADETGYQILKPGAATEGGYAIAAHPKRPWQLASIDFMRSDRSRLVELKTAGWRFADQWGEPGTDQIPEPYVVQVTHQMAVLEIPVCDVAVLIGGNDFRIYTVEFNAALAEILEQEEAEFWERVQRRDPPPVDWADPRTPALVQALHTPKGGRVELPADALTLAAKYQTWGEEIKALEQERDTFKAKLAEMMGPAEEGLLTDGRIVSRKLVEKDAYTVKASQYVRFSVKEPKASKKKEKVTA